MFFPFLFILLRFCGEILRLILQNNKLVVNKKSWQVARTERVLWLVWPGNTDILSLVKVAIEERAVEIVKLNLQVVFGLTALTSACFSSQTFYVVKRMLFDPLLVSVTYLS